MSEKQKITMDGQYQYKNGEPAIVLTVTRPCRTGGNPVLSMDQHGVVWYHDSHGVSENNCHSLVTVPPPPKMVPLNESDFIIGLTQVKCGTTTRPSVVLTTGDNEVLFACAKWKGVSSIEFESMRSHGWEYSNDHGNTWHRCEKPAQS